MNRKELKERLSKLNVDPDAYSLNGTLREDALVLDEVYGKWKVFYVERGKAENEQIFDTEREACQYFLELLKDDPSARRDYR